MLNSRLFREPLLTEVMKSFPHLKTEVTINGNMVNPMN